ncbi:glycosyltransferase family 9 protein [Synechococcus sp. HB1133]|uniref:glycosyltransferase family 9 protein n=1 Tax=unclassified Synechococcus TaxID=2626047 RepID=UPI00140C0439|nr:MULTISPECIES: glycosyltransferase family 9 protein [unclassified Synechococcus]MCB4421459.1 glycosyltransferase family 9 protein [Synechococcus sp. HB1133]MCB4431190.1 glycosyltransferase family 9 protein [Synechococcus sp. HBA1120]NHI80401.1 lipopolysaccharide heptosyltransferase family protein [Synechococcus sp. HB1133]
MERFEGNWLGDNPHIVVLGSRKLGNFIATLPLLCGLRKKYPKCRLDFWGSEITKDFEEALVKKNEGNILKLDWRISWDGGIGLEDLLNYNNKRGRPDLVINCDGFNPITSVLTALISPRYACGNAMRKDLSRELETGEHIYNKVKNDKEWDSEKFLDRYKGAFRTQYIGEIFCRMAFVEPIYIDFESIELPTKDPSFDIPSILIHCTSTRSAKLWVTKYWSEVLDWCSEKGVSVGLVGADRMKQEAEYNSGNIEDILVDTYGLKGHNILVDLRGKTDLIELAGACKGAKGVISVDAGPMHVAAAVGTSVMAVVGNDENGVGASPIRLWLPQTNNIQRTVSKNHCQECMNNKYKNDECLIKNHDCMEGVGSHQVINWLESITK